MTTTEEYLSYLDEDTKKEIRKMFGDIINMQKPTEPATKKGISGKKLAAGIGLATAVTAAGLHYGLQKPKK